jgi:LysR family transcriptional regulator, regulator for metE and metH
LVFMDLELRHFRVVAAIVDAGGVTAAALRLHLTQSALSYQLRDAEDKLGTALFLRAGKKMVLTPAGEELLGSARRILADVSRTEERVRGFGTGAAGTLRLSTECYTCYHWLPPVMDAFRRSFPGVEVRIELEATRRPVPALLEGKLDVAIVSSDADDPRLALSPIFGDEMVVVMSRRHRLARRPFVRPADLAGETILVYPPREESLLAQIVSQAGAVPGEVRDVPLTEAIIELARAGQGIGFLARWAVPPGRSGLSKRPLGRSGYRRQWKVATLRGHRSGPALAELLRLLGGLRPPGSSSGETGRIRQ